MYTFTSECTRAVQPIYLARVLHVYACVNQCVAERKLHFISPNNSD